MRLHVIVRGRVQGVGFRWFVRGEARALELRGWVKNRRDGGVEVEASGPTHAIEALRRTLAEGPPGAHVTDVEELPAAGGAEATEDGELPFPFEIAR